MVKQYIAVFIASANEEGEQIGEKWFEYQFEGADKDGKIRAQIGADITETLNRQEIQHAPVRDASDGDYSQDQP